MVENESKELAAFIVDNGFIWGPSPEIYGGVGGFYDYGPLGKQLKNNVENAIRRVFQINEFWEVECPTIMPAIVWKASGHLGGFSDPLIKCSKCNAEFRVDRLIAEFNPNINVGGYSNEKLLKVIKDNNIVCTNCKSQLKNEIIKHSLMMKTTIGTDLEAYNRPETATTTYLPFKRFDEFFRKKYPFGVFQIGKAYRNEISPRQSVMRGREFTQAEGQLFILKDQKNNFAKFEEVKNKKLPLWFNAADAMIETTLGDAINKGKLKNQAYAWCLNLAYELFLAMGIPKNRIRMRQHAENEKAFYADDAWDVEVLLNSYGWYEVCGIHDRTDYDLSQHSKESKQKLETFNEETKQREIPHILEIAFGTDRPTFALLDIFFDGKDPENKMFRIPANLAPIKIAVLPLVNKLEKEAKEVYYDLKERFTCQYDRSGSIGRRYARQDEIGTPYCITIDFDSLEKQDVTIRDRDSTKQVRIPIKNVPETIRKLVNGEIEFKNI